MDGDDYSLAGGERGHVDDEEERDEGDVGV